LGLRKRRGKLAKCGWGRSRKKDTGKSCLKDGEREYKGRRSLEFRKEIGIPAGVSKEGRES